MNEEVSDKSINLAVRCTKVSVRALVKTLLWAQRHYSRKKSEIKQKDVQPKGKQTLKELIGQGQGVSSMDIGDEGIRDFKKLANKYGVDFAIVKDKGVEPARYTVFFKARDADAITQVLKEYSDRKVMRKKQAESPSVLDKLKKLKDIVAKTPHKEKVRRKVPER
ncbi:MAG: PcfB family protein [Bacteroidaceae bacterium]|nr:PcfB family protein [Bacteroidaceae bacterium]